MSDCPYDCDLPNCPYQDDVEGPEIGHHEKSIAFSFWTVIIGVAALAGYGFVSLVAYLARLVF